MTFYTIQIPHDMDSVHYYVEKYKAFRLLALKTAPEAFGSTYERECAFAEDVWISRLANSKATTFITTESDRIVCTLTAIGPLPCTVEESSPTGDPWIPVNPVTSDGSAQLHYRLNGMFTLPEVRGQGVAKAIVKRALKYGLKEAAGKQQSFNASIVVDADNPGAVSLYKKCGFVSVREEVMPGTARLVILMKYSPSGKSAADSVMSSS